MNFNKETKQTCSGADQNLKISQDGETRRSLIIYQEKACGHKAHPLTDVILGMWSKCEKKIANIYYQMYPPTHTDIQVG